MFFRKNWKAEDVTNVVYEALDKKKNMRVKLTLEFYSKDACNKKNNTPRPKINYRRCYDLKDGFESVSNFYEIDAEDFEKLKELIKSANSASEGRFKAFHRKRGIDYSVILIRRKKCLLTAISESDKLFASFKAAITVLLP